MSKLGVIKQQWRTGLPWAYALIWRTDARSCLCMAGSSLLTALLTPLSVVLMAHIVGLLRQAFAEEGRTATVDPWPWILLAGGMTIVGASASALKKYSQNRLTDSVTLRVRSMLLARASELDLETLENREVQNELSLLTKDSGESLVKSATEAMNLVSYVLRVVSLAGIMLAIEPFGTMLILLAAIPLSIVGTLISQARHKLRKSNAETQRWSNYYARHLTQYRLAPEVRLLDLAPWMIEQTENRINELQRVKRRIDRMDLAFRLGTTLVSVLLLLIAIHRVAQHTAAGTLQIERFVAFWLAAWRIARDAATLAGALTNATKAWIEMFHIRAFLERPASQGPAPLSPTLQCGRIELNDVSFRYAGGRTNAVNHVSLRIEPGETVAIVGHNGAGKTTLVKLLAGLYRPSSGEIRFGDIAQDQLDLAELHRQMAIVMQSPMRLEATAAENIALGDRDRLWGNAEAIRQVATDLGGDAMIQKFPEGYDTQLGRQFGEYDLSGGQWQKIAIMRALARDPRIVLLDEPTSGIDVNAEREILAGMRRLVAGRTAILISHRFATVAMADRIVVLEDGEIAEQGTHEQLLAAGGIYAAMYRTQTRQAA